MKKFKEVDAWISIILITGFAIATIINRDYTFLIGYFVVGGWQAISMIIHANKGWFTENNSKRYKYHWIVVITCMVVLLGIAIYPLLFYTLIVLLLVAPFMAIYYTWLCYQEVYIKMKRPLDLLK